MGVGGSSEAKIHEVPAGASQVFFRRGPGVSSLEAVAPAAVGDPGAPARRGLTSGVLGAGLGAGASDAPVSAAPRFDSAAADRVGLERRAWEEHFGASWLQALGRLARWADRAGIPIRSGSSELLRSSVAASWGWGDPNGFAGRPSWPGILAARGAWVLRVPPGCVAAVRQRVESCPALAPVAGRPVLRVEECAAAYLPARVPAHVASPHAAARRVLAGPRAESRAVSAWPSREAWIRAAWLLGGTGATKPFIPGSEAELLEGLRGSVAPGRVVLEAWDLYRGALAWEHDRAAFWLTRQASGFRDRRAALEWRHRAFDWGLRILDPCVEKSSLGARVRGNTVRLGLESMSDRVARRTMLRLERQWTRERRASITAWQGRRFVRARFTVSRLVLLGREVLRRLGGALVSARTRFGSGGGNSPFQPHTVIAHNPRPAALRSEPLGRARAA